MKASASRNPSRDNQSRDGLANETNGRRRFLARCAAGVCGGLFAATANADYFADRSEPAGVVIEDFPLLRQPDAISCGPTCCAMLLRHYGANVRIAALKEVAGTRLMKFGGEEIGFTWPSRMVKALDAHNLKSTLQKRASLSDLPPLIRANRPPILLVRSSPKTWHYVSAIGFRGTRFFHIADPLGFNYWRSAETLDRAWSFEGDITGDTEMGTECNVCKGRGKVGFAPCLVCGADGEIFDVRRRIVQGNIIEPIAARTMIVPQ